MTNGRVPSVREIRMALEDVPGALRYEPLPEDVRAGNDRATPIWTPDRGGFLVDSVPDNPDWPDGDDEFSDEPSVVFEVPPAVTEAEIDNVLSEHDGGDMKRLEQVRGIDALGWYMTFHQQRYQHGIYIPIKGILVMARDALAGLPVSMERRIELAFHAIFRHELFHFATDCMAANWELVSGREVYWKAKTAYRNAAGYVELEEALANAYMLRGFRWPGGGVLRKSGGGYAALVDYCKRQPAGYDLAPQYAKNRSGYVGGCQELSAQFQHASVVDPEWAVPPGLDSSQLYPGITRIAWNRCPILHPRRSRPAATTRDQYRPVPVGSQYHRDKTISERTATARQTDTGQMGKMPINAGKIDRTAGPQLQTVEKRWPRLLLRPSGPKDPSSSSIRSQPEKLGGGKYWGSRLHGPLAGAGRPIPRLWFLDSHTAPSQPPGGAGCGIGPLSGLKTTQSRLKTGPVNELPVMISWCQ